MNTDGNDDDYYLCLIIFRAPHYFLTLMRLIRSHAIYFGGALQRKTDLFLIFIINMHVCSCKRVHRFSEAGAHLNSRSYQFLIFARSTEPSLVLVMNAALHLPTLLTLTDGTIESQM